MPTEPDNTPEAPHPKRKRTYPKPENDGFVVFYVDGFAQMTPEQRTWPVVTVEQMIRGTMDPPPEPPSPENESKDKAAE